MEEIEEDKTGSRLRMSPGRPRKSDENKKSIRIAFMVTKEQNEAIEAQAKDFRLTVSEYCNKMVSTKEFVRPFTAEELKLKTGLVGMANNLNQIAYQANAAGYDSVNDSCLKLLNEIKKELEKFRKI